MGVRCWRAGVLAAAVGERWGPVCIVCGGMELVEGDRKIDLGGWLPSKTGV